MLACKLPLVAAAVGDTALILQACPQCLFSPGDTQMLASQIARQLVSPVLPELQASSWFELARGLEDVLQRAVAAS
jgi:hypothetical protein